ncbi:MAG: AAA family ATPase [Treponema sp.]|nr:AAA family ATPase [Treponema sp.]
MAKVYILCGKICSGKSTYSQQLRKDKKAVILSVDDITLTLLGQNGGDTLDVYVENWSSTFFRIQ